MSGGALLPVADALQAILNAAKPVDDVEMCPLAQAYGRTLAQDLKALRTQPPFDGSAMDGYALRADDIAQVPKSLAVVGESAAGHRHHGVVQAGQAVRIFTGAPLPDGADTIVIQENTQRDGDFVTILQSEPVGRHIRRAGTDFTADQILLTKGRRLGASELALAAAMNHAHVPVERRPRIGILASGDELVLPGQAVGPDQIVASNTFAVSAFVQAAGGEVVDLGIAADTKEALAASIQSARDQKVDVLVTIGGASVGDHDLVQGALLKEGMVLDFWKIAMRPGKPLMHGRLGDMQILGLPGNPVSAIVCGLLFLVPMVRALCGDPQAGRDPTEPALLGAAMKANDNRQDYVRASFVTSPDGLPVATPFARQDSSMLRILAEAECLIVRPPFAPAAGAGAACRVVRLTPWK